MSTDETAKFSPASERAALEDFLDAQRDALIRKIDGLDDTAARKTSTASSLSLLALVKHSAIWERRLFQTVMAGRDAAGDWPEVEDAEDATFLLDDTDTVEHWVAYYRAQIEESRAITAAMDLDAPCARTDILPANVRWILFQMTAETARHAGHADIIRESIDGSRGL
jgi:hypothetical protein